MGTFRTVAVVVRSLIIHFGHRYIEKTFGSLNLRGNLGEVGDFERCAVLFDDIHQRNIMEIQLIVLNRKLILREFEGLFNQIDVFVFHL